jgi:hypothetical protein
MFSAVKPEGKRPPRRLKSRWLNVKIELRAIGWGLLWFRIGTSCGLL